MARRPILTAGSVGYRGSRFVMSGGKSGVGIPAVFAVHQRRPGEGGGRRAVHQRLWIVSVDHVRAVRDAGDAKRQGGVEARALWKHVRHDSGPREALFQGAGGEGDSDDAMTAQGLTSRELEGNLLLPAETEGREHVDHEHG